VTAAASLVNSNQCKSFMFCLFYFRFAGHYPQKICINEMQVHGATLWVLPLCVLARFLPAHAAAEA